MNHGRKVEINGNGVRKAQQWDCDYVHCPIDELMSALNTSEKGTSEQEAIQRLRDYVLTKSAFNVT
jgi:hypothetical protein